MTTQSASNVITVEDALYSLYASLKNLAPTLYPQPLPRGFDPRLSSYNGSSTTTSEIISVDNCRISLKYISELVNTKSITKSLTEAFQGRSFCDICKSKNIAKNKKYKKNNDRNNDLYAVLMWDMNCENHTLAPSSGLVLCDACCCIMDLDSLLVAVASSDTSSLPSHLGSLTSHFQDINYHGNDRLPDVDSSGIFQQCICLAQSIKVLSSQLKDIDIPFIDVVSLFKKHSDPILPKSSKKRTKSGIDENCSERKSIKKTKK